MLYIKSDMNIPSIEDIISKSKAENKKIALVFPIYYPSALLRTFDIHPFEIWNAPYADLSLADSHIQSYTCSLGRILLSFVKDKRYRENYDLIFIPHICDTFQQIGSLLNDFIKAEKPVINFYLPKRNDESGIIFCTEELKRIVKILEDICGRKFDNNRFLSELEKDYEINNLIREAYLKREYLNISDYEFYRIITSRSFLPAEDFIKLLNDLLSDKSERQRASGKKIFISGISAEPPEIFQVINNTGASVVFDDLAVSGRRVFQIPPPSAEPFRRQSEIMLYTVPDAEKGSPVENKAKWLREETNRTGATGGIFYIMKFCEPEYFYYPQLKIYLANHNIRTFVVEYEMTGKISKQNINRIQSFIEGL